MTDRRRITVEQALKFIDGLRKLDGYDRIIGAPPAEQVLRMSFNFSGDALIAIAINGNRLSEVAAAHQEATNRLIRQISGADQIAPPTAADAEAMQRYRDQVQQFTDELAAARAAEVEVELRPISVKGLRLDTNPVPPSALGLLEPLLASDEAA
jgi:hypothetical protein